MNLEEFYEAIGSKLEERYSTREKIENMAHLYINYRVKLNKILDRDGHVVKNNKTIPNTNYVIKENDVQISTLIDVYVKSVFQRKEYYKLMTKDDVQEVISAAVKPYNVEFNIEHDFLDLLRCVTVATWVSEWDFLLKLQG